MQYKQVSKAQILTNREAGWPRDWAGLLPTGYPYLNPHATKVYY